MFGKSTQEWTPLTFGTIFSEGWTDAWIAPPSGSGGALRQGWITLPDAFFNRMVIGFYTYSYGTNGIPSEQVGYVQYETPITRRYMFGFVMPVVDNEQGNGVTNTAFGDVILENRFMLHEDQDLSVSLNINMEIPTGYRNMGYGRTILMPYLAAWRDMGNGFSLRGTAGVDIPLDTHPNNADTVFDINLAFGQTLTRHDVPLLGDFTYFVDAHLLQATGVNQFTLLSLTPGFRTHLGNDFYLLAGIEVPVTNSAPFNERFTVMLVKGF